jgi:hypothetical protein
MNRTLAIFLACLVFAGCSRPPEETAIIILKSADTPYETATVRIKHRCGEMGAYQFITGQVVGKSLVNVRVDHTLPSPIVKFTIKKGDVVVPVSIPLDDPGEIAPFPFGITVTIRNEK